MSRSTSPDLDENTQDFLEQAATAKFDFHQVSVKAAGDEKLKAAINNAVLRQYTGRQLRMLDLPDPDALRELAGQIKQHALDYLDYYLEQLTTRRTAGRCISPRRPPMRNESSSTSRKKPDAGAASRANRW